MMEAPCSGALAKICWA